MVETLSFILYGCWMIVCVCLSLHMMLIARTTVSEEKIPKRVLFLRTSALLVALDFVAHVIIPVSHGLKFARGSTFLIFSLFAHLSASSVACSTRVVVVLSLGETWLSYPNCWLFSVSSFRPKHWCPFLMEAKACPSW